ncbi:VF530 family DNA-binding protein [Shivajiella indica]|uniref:VF530 family DNA-binding protein n=1 Tax=Shivajiella indica TaxID=872115 RepID=A0ABW5BD76_9BACT
MEKPKKPEQESQPNNPLHGVRLVDILDYLVEKYGWKKLGEKITIRCFTHDPSINSSLKFLRKTEWARTKVEEFYIRSIQQGRRRNN